MTDSPSHPEVARFRQQYPEVRYVDALVADLCGRAIGKRLPIDQLEVLYRSGSPLCAAMQMVDALGNTADPMGFGFSDGDPDAWVKPVKGTLKPNPWRGAGYAQVLCQFRDGDGNGLWHEPREVLNRVLKRFESLELTPVVAAELEFYFIDARRDDQGVAQPVVSPLTGMPEQQGRVLSLDKLDEFDSVLTSIQDSCLLQDIPATTMISEYGAGQFEVNLRHSNSALQAADHAVLLRRLITGVARQQGMDATFMSKPFADQSGNGLHVHLSLEDGNGTNIFSADQGESPLSFAVAGLQQTMAEAMALFAPNLNVFRRFKPDEFVPVTRDWGENNRSMAFRLPISTPGDRRIEHRVSGAEANPYLVIAAVLAGVHHGITNRLVPSARAEGNAGSSVDPDLPLTPWKALQALEHASIIPGYLGEDYPALYAEVKQAELDAFMNDIFEREHQWYL